MPIVYTLVGLLAAYFAYRAAGWAGIALVFVAALVVGGSGGPEGLVRFATLGIILLLVVIYLGTRRQRAAWRDRR
jgi:molecular chaperone DnaJ